MSACMENDREVTVTVRLQVRVYCEPRDADDRAREAVEEYLRSLEASDTAIAVSGYEVQVT